MRITARTQTFTVVLLCLIAASHVHAWFTYCTPYATYMDTIQTTLQRMANDFGTVYTEDRKEAHRSLGPILDRLQSDKARLKSSKLAMETYVSNKLAHSSVGHDQPGADDVELLKQMFTQLDNENGRVVVETDKLREQHDTRNTEAIELQEQIKLLKTANQQLERSVMLANGTLTRTLATKRNLEGIVSARTNNGTLS